MKKLSLEIAKGALSRQEMRNITGEFWATEKPFMFGYRQLESCAFVECIEI